ADRSPEACRLRSARRPDDSSRRSRKNRVLALKACCPGQSAAGLHEIERDVPELRDDTIHVSAQNRREIGIDHCRVASGDEADERAHGVTGRDLRKSGRARPGRQFELCCRVLPCMRKYDGDRLESFCPATLEQLSCGLLVERSQSTPRTV